MRCKEGEPGKKTSVAVESKNSNKLSEIQTFDKRVIVRLLAGAAEGGQKTAKVISSKDQCSSACTGTFKNLYSSGKLVQQNENDQINVLIGPKST